MKDIVDLGAKAGGATTYILAEAAKRFPLMRLTPAKCVCVDLRGKHAKEVESKGFHFVRQNILSAEFEWPAALVYCAFNFLEHLPRLADAQEVVSRMGRSSKAFLWFRLPSFEENVRSVLRSHGLRLAWDTWRDHPTKFLEIDLMRRVGKMPQWVLFDRFPVRRVYHTMNDFVVPLDAPKDIQTCTKAMARTKPSVPFNPPLWAETELIFSLGVL